MALPKYDQIATDIRHRIVRGELTPGDTLPPEAELTTRWSTARVTVARALDVLWEEGLINPREGGGGAIVRERAPLARTARERYGTAVRAGRLYTVDEYAEGRALAYEVGISPAGRWTRTDEYPMGD